jgi:hypothetical protein
MLEEGADTLCNLSGHSGSMRGMHQGDAPIVCWEYQGPTSAPIGAAAPKTPPGSGRLPLSRMIRQAEGELQCISEDD